jgi:hypothetical protein
MAAMHVEPAPCRREAVAISGRRSAARGQEQRPFHGGGVEGVEVVEMACRKQGRLGERKQERVGGREEAGAR